MLIFEDIIINYENKTETPIVREVHIIDGVVKHINPNDKLKNLEEFIDGSPAINYDLQKNFSNK